MFISIVQQSNSVIHYFPLGLPQNIERSTLFESLPLFSFLILYLGIADLCVSGVEQSDSFTHAHTHIYCFSTQVITEC